MNRNGCILWLWTIIAAGCARGDGPAALERNKHLVRRAHEQVWSRGDLKAIDEIYAVDYVAHWVGGPDSLGRDSFKRFVADAYRRAPDRSETVDQIVAEGDLVVTRFTTRGTFASQPGEPSPRKQITLQEIAIHRIHDGKIAEQWTVEGVMDVRHLDLDAGGGPVSQTIQTIQTIRTQRLVLRRWTAEDRAAFAEMNADPEVMRHFPALLSRAESDALVDRVEEHFASRGWGPWAVEIPGVTAFAGFTGLSVPRFEAPFTPCVEIGWRLARTHWGQGIATEAARAVMAFGFERLGLEQIVSFTVPDNLASRRVMEKLGMTHDPRDDFDHPALPAGHRLQRHVLYRKRP